MLLKIADAAHIDLARQVIQLPRLLAPEGPRRRPRDLERGSRRLPPAAPGPDHGPDRDRHRGQRDRQARRHLRAFRGADLGRGPHRCCRRSLASSSATAAEPCWSRSTAAASRTRASQGSRPRAAIASSPRPRRTSCSRTWSSAIDLGGFTADGSEYVIATAQSRRTPTPWVNVLANPGFGTVVSESGLAYTWSENAHEFRLTPWSNDPVGGSTRRGDLPARRGNRAFLVADAAAGTRRDAVRHAAMASVTACSSTRRAASIRSCGFTWIWRTPSSSRC